MSVHTSYRPVFGEQTTFPPFEFLDALLQAGDFRFEGLVFGDQLVDLLGLATDDLEEILLGHPGAHGQYGNGRSARLPAGHPSDR
ncbi:hypothetical protein [Deinococcus sp. 6GRE01]|uniref:hypothetical protein n=1 Tax=Deinococcus sp. 6GRE01 TaxID=2745873 RepID=UPI001E38B306|nr:hypothetical protein [Deinococcus sp. 6GRE01]MCD0155810.1 hypothetical protein [Deinococcus sp. 6GRE01]